MMKFDMKTAVISVILLIAIASFVLYNKRFWAGLSGVIGMLLLFIMFINDAYESGEE